jgi:succinoglycan biosynthesis protein ExoU
MIDRSQSRDQAIVGRRENEAATACVDVLIAARNRADTIECAVTSALAQDEVRAVIVVDDGSADDTAALARRCDPDGKRLVVERLASSVGPSAARNVAIEISTAPWLAVLDADDFFLHGRICALLSQSGAWDLVADELVQISEDRVGLQSFPHLTFDASHGRRLSFEQFVLGNVTRRGFHRKELGYLKPMIRRSFLDRHALRYNPALRLGEDFVLYARALAAGARFLVIPMAGYVAVERANSLSARHIRQDLERLGDCVSDLMAISHLAPSERGALAKLYGDLDCRAQWLILVEAIKSHNYLQFVSAFFHSSAMTLYLMRRLLEEAPRHLRKRRGFPYNVDGS